MDEDLSRASSTPYAEAGLTYGPLESRRGHLCFGRLCDMRVGTILANSINIIVRIIYLVLERNGGYYYPYQVTVTDYWTLAFSLVAVFGAWDYQLWCTLIAAIGLTWVFLPRLGDSEVWYMFLLDALVIYPTIVLAYEIHYGVISKEPSSDEFDEYIDPSAM